MKVLLDEVNLGLKHGTGLSNYARGIHHLLTSNGHEANLLYGHSSASNGKLFSTPSPHTFLQKVALGKEKPLNHRHDLLTLGIQAPIDFIRQVSRFYLAPKQIKIPNNINLREFTKYIPSQTTAYNIPLIYERAYTYFMLTGQLFKFKADKSINLYHSTFPFPLLAANKPNVCTFHDIIPLVMPGVTKINLDRYRKMCALILNQFDIIITDSNQTKRDILNEFEINPEKIIMNYLHTDIVELANKTDATQNQTCLKRFGLKENEFFLYVGALEPRKNIVRLIKSYLHADTELPLVIAGKDGWLYEEIHEAMRPLLGESKIKGKRIVRLEYPSNEEVVALMTFATALLFPSLYEGFGLPVLEAMSLGCPVMTSNNSSLSEIAGTAALLIDPYEIDEMSHAITKLATDSSLRETLSAQGLLQASHFTQQKSREQLMHAYSLALINTEEKATHVIPLS